MSSTLALIGAGWDSIRSLATHGQRMDFYNRLRSLIARPDLPTSVAGDAHRLAGELLVDAERYREACRHLRAAAAFAPTHAHTFYLWGLACERDPHGCDRLAAQKFGKASKLDPGNPTYRAAYGRASVRCGCVKLGICQLLDAAASAQGNLEILRVVTEGLIEAGRLDAAKHVLNKARFLCFESSKNREIVALMERVRYESARTAQREARRQRQDAQFATDGGRMVIPFVRKVNLAKSGLGSQTAGSTRRDVVSLPKPHFPRLRIRRADR
jgi:hypothetical protein